MRPRHWQGRRVGSKVNMAGRETDETVSHDPAGRQNCPSDLQFIGQYRPLVLYFSWSLTFFLCLFWADKILSVENSKVTVPHEIKNRITVRFCNPTGHISQGPGSMGLPQVLPDHVDRRLFTVAQKWKPPGACEWIETREQAMYLEAKDQKGKVFQTPKLSCWHATKEILLHSECLFHPQGYLKYDVRITIRLYGVYMNHEWVSVQTRVLCTEYLTIHMQIFQNPHTQKWDLKNLWL